MHLEIPIEITLAVLLIADLEEVKVGISPAHGFLQYLVQPGQASLRTNLKLPPYRRLDILQLDPYLI